MPTMVNTTVLSNFAVVGRLDLLRAVFSTLYLTQAVFEEIQVGLDEGYAFYMGIEAHIYPFCENSWLHLTTVEGTDELAVLFSLPTKLHRGEATSLAIAKCRGWRILTDDTRKFESRWIEPGGVRSLMGPPRRIEWSHPRLARRYHD